jgi:hypothetical protein
LRYTWRKGDKLLYRYVSGKMRAGNTPWDAFQQDVGLAVRSVENSAAAVVEVENKGAGGWAEGDLFMYEPEVQRGVYRVDSRGRVLKALESEGGRLGENEPWGRGPAAELSQLIIGVPISDLEVGVLHSCLLPPGPIRVGERWSDTLRSPDLTGMVSVTDFQGTLVRLQQDKGRTYAIIECKLRPSPVRVPYVCEAKFDVERGRMVWVTWKKLLMAPPGWVRREDLVEPGRVVVKRSGLTLKSAALSVMNLGLALVLFLLLPLRIARRQWLRKRGLSCGAPGAAERTLPDNGEAAT